MQLSKSLNVSRKNICTRLNSEKIFVLAIWPPKLHLTNWSSAVQLSWLPSRDAWGAEEFLNKSSRKPAVHCHRPAGPTQPYQTEKPQIGSGKSIMKSLSVVCSSLDDSLLPFIWSPSSLGGVHCAQRVGAHVNVHGCDGGGLVGRGEVEWHDICTNHQSTRWWVLVAGMVVLAGQATDGLATVQVRWWSALCAAAVPSGTTAAAPPPSPTYKQPLARGGNRRFLERYGSI